MEERGITVRETVDARKKRFGADDLEELLGKAAQVIVAKGKKTLEFSPKQKDCDWEALTKAALGPSGNLRAPTLKHGTTYLVGFGDEAWADHFDG